ncbi:unnamed protein product [Triticum turgidum subsp. durum]|uniref:HMA domain-containing protein n=1 Tax=Triticum turgidum subsp. durum TaxID=4567 RepID=A0A9R0WYN9_TRITD|nr:unnamed protein product [Triticum turgidum subsp. durum]
MDLQTFVLRVTIHCHGCKKKVRKVLKSVEGRAGREGGCPAAQGDGDRHRGRRDAHQEAQQVWQAGPAMATHACQESRPCASRRPRAGRGRQQGCCCGRQEAGGGAAGRQLRQEAGAGDGLGAEKKPETEKEAESEKKADKEEAKPSDEAKKDGGEGAAAEPKPKAKGTEPAAAAKEAGDDEGEAKKKQSKPKDADRSLAPAPAPAHAPRYAHQEFNAPQPVMSYNMAQPRASVSHYAPQPEQGYSQQQQAGYSSSSSMMVTQHPPPPAQQAYSQQAQPMQQWSPSYLYMPYPHASPESYYQDYYSPPGTHASPPPPPPLQDSYRLFDDENPNSCSVM